MGCLPAHDRDEKDLKVNQCHDFVNQEDLNYYHRPGLMYFS